MKYLVAVLVTSIFICVYCLFWLSLPSSVPQFRKLLPQVGHMDTDVKSILYYTTFFGDKSWAFGVGQEAFQRAQ